METTQPTWFRSAKNKTVAAIVAQRFVDPDATNFQGIQLPSAVTTVGYGVTSEDIPIDGTGSIQIEGIAQVVCSAAIALGALVQSGTDGRAATAATNSAVRGRCVKATAGSGEVAEVELWKGRFIAP
jgi:hypothetical protein